MIGAEPMSLKYHYNLPGQTVFRVNSLSLKKSDQYGINLVDIEMELKRGEILGIAGVSGNGQRELLYVLSGEDTRALPSSVTLKEQSVGALGPK